MSDIPVRQRVADLIEAVTDGAVPATEALSGGSLVALGLDSLGMLRLVDAIELQYDVVVDLHHPDQRLDTLDDLVTLLATAGADDARTVS